MTQIESNGKKNHGTGKKADKIMRKLKCITMVRVVEDDSAQCQLSEKVHLPTGFGWWKRARQTNLSEKKEP